MPNIKKVRCPCCRNINSVDVTEELERHKRNVIRRPGGASEIGMPKNIVVTCYNCGKKFKVNL